MNSPLDQAGVLEVVMERFEKHRLPRILDIKKLVDQGELLCDMDIDFLEKVLQDTRKYKPFADEHPEYQSLYANVAHLYHEITNKALANERKG